ncbi:MAG: tetratricopeptide repeat protein, partial [Candidatus Omnitrophica bacterium]|nr:tetratricopeptide repeat protein [Candidatus Omnitrophota bacterium]
NENAAKAGAMREELLGYIAEKRPQLAGIIDKGTDPKDKVQLIRPYMLSASDPRSVIKFFRERLTADPKNKMFKFQLARAYFTAGNFYESEYLLLSLTLTYPGYNQAWELLGLVYEKQEDIDSAMECYEKAVSISPDMLTSLNNLAWRYAEQGVDLDKALEYSERANKLAPDNVSFLDTLAEVYFKTGDKTRAEELLEQAVSMAVETKSKKLRYLRKRLKEIQDS